MNFAIEQHLGPFDNLHPLRAADFSGVYFLCRGTSIVYVGKSKNIAHRIAQHIGSKDFNTVMVMRVPEELLGVIEMSWIRKLKPKLNMQRLSKEVKTVKTIWLSPDVVRRLKKAAESEGMSQSIYIEQMLRARFKKEGIE
jgi:excinuclease UvrABC nuclease subunit